MVPLPLPGQRVGVRPTYPLSAARGLRDVLNGKRGFRDCDLRAIVTIVRGGFGVGIFYPPDEPLSDNFPAEIDGVPVVVI